MIEFGVWAPDEATFKQSWIDAGILEDVEGYVFAPEYVDHIIISDQTRQGWAPSRNGEAVAGWHANVRVTGLVAQQFSYGLPQEGDIWARTWAAEVFQLIEQAADPTTGFPAGYRNAAGVTYCDPSAFSSPSNAWV